MKSQKNMLRIAYIGVIAILLIVVGYFVGQALPLSEQSSLLDYEGFDEIVWNASLNGTLESMNLQEDGKGSITIVDENGIQGTLLLELDMHQELGITGLTTFVNNEVVNLPSQEFVSGTPVGLRLVRLTDKDAGKDKVIVVGVYK